jgi:hypothetical protein
VKLIAEEYSAMDSALGIRWNKGIMAIWKGEING